MNNEPTLDHSKIADALGSHPRELTAAEMNKLHAKGNVASVGANLSPTQSLFEAMGDRVQFLSSERSELLKQVEAKNAEIVVIRSCVGADDGDDTLEMVQSWKDMALNLRAEIARLRDGCQKLSRAMSKIDYAVGDPNEMGVSLYDTDCDEDRVARRVEQEIARLRAVVDKHPKTADGVDATTIDEVWICGEYRHKKGAELRIGSIEMERVGVWCAVFNCEYEGQDRYPVSDCYSTREAAEAAAKGSAK